MGKDENKKKYVVNLNLSKGESKKTIEFNISNDGVKEKSTSKKETINRSKKVKKNIFIDGFFGWNKFKWLIRELVKIYSPEPSYFSKKRFESSIAFVIAQWGMVLYLLNNYTSLSMSDFLLWASAEFVIAGYYVTQIQREKKDKGYDNSDTYEINESDYEDSDYEDTDLK